MFLSRPVNILSNFTIKVQQFGQCIYKKIHNFDLNKVIQNVALYAQHHVTYAPAKFKVAASNGLGEGALTRKYKVTCNVAQYHLHHVTNSPAKFGLATEEIHLLET